MPEDLARRLGFAAGDEATLSDEGRRLTIERLDEQKRKQLERMMRIIDEDDAVLSALAK